MSRWPLPALAALAAAALAAACAAPQRVPAELAPAPGESLVRVVPAYGVQIYECRAGADARLEWAFVAPHADLFDDQGRKLGTHGAGPFWQANDGSRVVGSVAARAAAPTPGAIPWLLLKTRPSGAPGEFSRVSSIQRINTVGGVAPSTPCTHTGATAQVPYRADYRFFSSTPNERTS